MQVCIARALSTLTCRRLPPRSSAYLYTFQTGQAVVGVVSGNYARSLLERGGRRDWQCDLASVPRVRLLTGGRDNSRANEKHQSGGNTDTMRLATGAISGYRVDRVHPEGQRTRSRLGRAARDVIPRHSARGVSHIKQNMNLKVKPDSKYRDLDLLSVSRVSIFVNRCEHMLAKGEVNRFGFFGGS